MKVILQKDIAKLGRRFDVKEVSSGYAQNLLIPKGLAVVANPESIKKAELERSKIEGERKVHEELLLKNIKDLDGVTINIKGKANEKGHLFAGIHKEVIVDELLKQTGLQIDPDFIQLEHHIKELGEHQIEVKGGGKSVKFKVVISALNAL